MVQTMVPRGSPMAVKRWTGVKKLNPNIRRMVQEEKSKKVRRSK